ncbi:MAG TPA: class I SAM-dependent methyltransferase, partial [Gemmatimonadaceae bacterium]|nr:class I SAM-dependent methyltransferase [Gemmatimonadaceae bacterium]
MLLRAAKRLVGEARCRWFDWTHRVETCGDVAPSRENVASDTLTHGRAYSPSHVTLLPRLFGSLDIDYGRYTFVDIGCGKGRALLVASEFPFRRIVGVEYDAQLHAIASRNVQRYRSRTQRCRDIECLHRDALQFPFPSGPLVVYLYHPFRPPVLVPLLRNLQASYARHPREILLLYASPFHAEHITAETALRPARE